MNSCRWGTLSTDFWTTALCIWLWRWWRPVAYRRGQRSMGCVQMDVSPERRQSCGREPAPGYFIERERAVQSLVTLPSLTVNLVLITTILRSCLQTRALLDSFVVLEEGKKWKTKAVIFRREATFTKHGLTSLFSLWHCVLHRNLSLTIITAQRQAVVTTCKSC